MNTRIKFLFFSLSLLLCFSLTSRAAQITPVFAKELMDIPGKSAQVLTVEYAPGESSSQHRHNAHTFVYVLEGSVVMGVKGSEPVTLTAGEVFYENPDDIHNVSGNASETEPAKVLVFFIKKTKAPPTVPVK